MSRSLLFPFDAIRPSQILAQYSEWLYFALILVFFISVAGITLRKQFSRPYAKPLIIAVGLILTVSVFMVRDQVAIIFSGFGVLGSLLLVIVVATIPFGLCVGFGMQKTKAFYLTFILMYLLSWVKYPQFYDGLTENGLGFVSFGLLIFFIYAVVQVVKFGKPSRITPKDFGKMNPFAPGIDSEINLQNREEDVLHKESRLTKLEAENIEQMAEALAGIQQAIEKSQGDLVKPERQKVAMFLREITEKEEVFKKGLVNLRKLSQEIACMDIDEFRKLEERLSKAKGKEKHIIQVEIQQEKEKVGVEKQIAGYENRMNQVLVSFNESISQAFERISNAFNALEAKPYLAQARSILKDASNIIREMGELEKKLLRLIKEEKRLLKHEKQDS